MELLPKSIPHPFIPQINESPQSKSQMPQPLPIVIDIVTQANDSKAPLTPKHISEAKPVVIQISTSTFNTPCPNSNLDSVAVISSPTESIRSAPVALSSDRNFYKTPSDQTSKIYSLPSNDLIVKMADNKHDTNKQNCIKSNKKVVTKKKQKRIVRDANDDAKHELQLTNWTPDSDLDNWENVKSQEDETEEELVDKEEPKQLIANSLLPQPTTNITAPTSAENEAIAGAKEDDKILTIKENQVDADFSKKI